MQPEKSLIALSALIATLPWSYEAKAADDGGEHLAPVMVEARRWKENADKVPQSVRKITAEEAQTPLFQDLQSLRKVVPNVQVDQSTLNERIVMRGMTAADLSLQEPVGYFVNDVAMPHGALQAPKLFNIESIEVMKGPQGTLYGRNTEAGAIKVDMRRPNWTPTMEIGLQSYGLDGRNSWEPGYMISGRASGAVIPDQAAVSFAFHGETTEGVHNNLADGNDTSGDMDQYVLAGGVEVWAGDSTNVLFRSVLDRRHFGNQRFRYIEGPNKTDRFVTNYNTTAFETTVKDVHSLRIDHDFNDMQLVSITGWSHYDRKMQTDPDSWILNWTQTELSHENNAISQELRLSSDQPDHAWRWLLGLYGFHEWADIDFHYLTPRQSRFTKIKQDGLAVFGQAEVKLMDELRLGFGSRVEHIRQDGSQDFITAGVSASYDDQQNVTTILPKISLSYDVSAKDTVYASYARGYLPGGYNYSASKSEGAFSYDPEYSWTAELGMKNRMLDDRLATNVALFHTMTSDKQLMEFVVSSSELKIINAAESEIYGIEFSADYALDDHWNLFANGSLQHAEATSYRDGGSDYSGNRLPMAANYTYGFGAAYDENPGGDGWFGQASVNGTGPYYFNVQHTATQSRYALCDAEIGYRFDNVTVSLWAKNIFDTEHYDVAMETYGGHDIAQDARPRMVGLNLSAKW